MYSDNNRWEEYIENQVNPCYTRAQDSGEVRFLVAEHTVPVVFKYGYNAGYVEVIDKERNVLTRSLPTL